MNLPNFLFKYKKVFLIIGFILVVIVLAWLIFFLFFYSPSEKPGGETPISTSTGPGQFPDAGEGSGNVGTTTGPGRIPVGGEKEDVDEIAQGGKTKTTQLNEDLSLSPTLSKDGNHLQYYNKTDGKFYRINENGEAEILSDRVFHAVENISWSPTKNKAILEYPDGSNIIYDFDSERQITLPKHWQDFGFSPDGNDIITESIGLDPDNRWLAIADSEGGNIRTIEKVGLYDDTVYPDWSPNQQIIAMYTKGVDFNRQEVFFIGLNNENFKSTIIEGRDFRPKWSEEGDTLLYSVYSSDNNLNPKLWTVNASGNAIGTGRKSLDVNTWSDKCSFINNEEIYCGVPISLEEGSGLFPEMAARTSDELYKINVKTGQKQLIATPDKAVNVSDINITEDGSTLYFKDELTQTIHKIQLK